MKKTKEEGGERKNRWKNKSKKHSKGKEGKL